MPPPIPETAKTDPPFALARAVLVGLFIVLIPFATQFLWIVDTHSPHFRYLLLGSTSTGPFDLVLASLALASIPLFLRKKTYQGFPIGLVGVVAFCLLTLIWVIPEPTVHGVARGLRFAGIAGLVVSIRWFPKHVFRTAVIWPVTASAGIQSVWALLQTFVWHSGDRSGITARFDHAWTHGFGSMDGGYALAAFLVLSVAIILASGAFTRLHPVMWAVVGLSSLAVATTYGRLGVLALGGIAFFYIVGAIWKRSGEYLMAAALATLPLLTGVAVTWTAWSVRTAETAAGNQSYRESLLSRAFTIIEQHPLTGVGPGDYGPTVARMGLPEVLTEVHVTVVHNVGVLVTAEYGIPFGILFALWIAALGIAAILTSIRAMALFASIVPYFVFDHTHMSYVYAIAGFGLWLATLDYLRLHRNDTRDGRYGKATSDHANETPELQQAG